MVSPSAFMTTARFRACEDFSLDPLFVGKVEKLSKGLADLDYCRVLEREVPETLRLLEKHGVKLLHFGPPVAMGVEHEITPDGGGTAIVEALASALEKPKKWLRLGTSSHPWRCRLLID